ncbi:MAG: CvpA family protein [Bacilli bacterium]|nr:CvpA family protein [Bacilli bacterium]
MNLNIVDGIIILLLVMGFVSGFKRGVVKQGVLTFGTILVVVLAFLFKNPLSMMLYKHCPFFTVGLLKNYSILNILLYELISFFILLSIFSLLLAIIIKISGVIERFLRSTVILALPSRLLGGVLGVVEFYIFTFVLLLIVTMPIFSISSHEFLTESKYKDKILNNTLMISHLSGGMVKSVNEINGLLNDEEKLGTNKFNCKALNIFVENKIVSEESINYLKDNNKIDFPCKIK